MAGSALLFAASSSLLAQENAAPAAAPQGAPAEASRPIYIRQYRVVGPKVLSAAEVENAVYPFLGPGRTAEDVEQARAALEKVYQSKGYQAAAVQVPPQQGRGGIIYLRVTEGEIGKIRVNGARYFLPADIKAKARSLAEGRALNFNDLTRDIVALNQLPDRQVTPSLKPGEVPGTVDVDLNVKDKFPLHGNVELNNRYSADTKPLRLSASLNYNNLWQLGHSIGGSFQISPEDLEQVKVFTGYYIFRFPTIEGFSLMLQGTKQNSNVNTLGSAAVAGRGEVLGARAIFTLQTGKDFYHSINFGFDYKRFDDQVTLAGITTPSPITYYPLSANYSATWAPKGSTTELNVGATFGIRGVGSRSSQYNNNRYRSDANFIYLRGDLAHTHDLPGGFELFAKVQGQISDQPLLNSEQFAGGGLGSARGYLEAEVLGDNAIFGTVELRSPSLLGWLPGRGNEWRIYLFGDAGTLTIHDPLPEQDSSFRLASFGIGSRLQLLDHLNGSVDIAIPTIPQGRTEDRDPFVTFRVWSDF